MAMHIRPMAQFISISKNSKRNLNMENSKGLNKHKLSNKNKKDKRKTNKTLHSGKQQNLESPNGNQNGDKEDLAGI